MSFSSMIVLLAVGWLLK